MTRRATVEFWSAGTNLPGRAAHAARRIEQEGFDGVSFGDTECISPDPFVGLGIAAAATERLKLAVGVTNPLTRHPAVTASAIAAVQAESGGRAVLGLGRGDSAVAKLGMPAATVKQMESFLRHLQSYLAGDDVEVAGTASRIQWLSGLDVPKVPVDVAATGPAVISLAARLAERVTFNVGADPRRLSQAVALARQACEGSGRPAEDVLLGAYLNVAPHPDRGLARELVKGVTATYARFSAMPGHPVDHLDPAEAAVIRALGDHYDMSRHGRPEASHVALLTPDFIDRFAVAGPVEHCVQRLTDLAALGIERFAVVGPANDAIPDAAAQSRRLLVEVVLPEVRKSVLSATA